MAAGGYTHSQLAAKLVVEGCLAHVAGNVRGAMPIAPIPLTELERADIGLKQGGQTMFYPAPPTGVFFDMSGAKAMVWFTEADSDRALAELETAMKRAYPKLKQLKDEAHPTDQRLRVRAYEVDFGNGRIALVNSEYPHRGAALFRTTVLAQARRN